MVSNYIQPIILVTIYPCLKADCLLNLRFIVIIGQLTLIYHKVLKREKVNGTTISSLNPIYISELIFKNQSLTYIKIKFHEDSIDFKNCFDLVHFIGTGSRCICSNRKRRF